MGIQRGFWRESKKERDHLEDLKVGRSIKLVVREILSGDMNLD
jgi:hypothetical protein